jgi:hypothetical protein
MSSYPTLVELADHVGSDLARGCEDAEEVSAAGRLELRDEARRATCQSTPLPAYRSARQSPVTNRSSE